jgi:hypothetical protein
MVHIPPTPHACISVLESISGGLGENSEAEKNYLSAFINILIVEFLTPTQSREK